MEQMKEKVALVTGAASGIGRATAVEFAREGCHLVISDINEVGLHNTAQEITHLGRKALPVRCDVSRREEVAHLRDRALGEFGGVDILMNNAGVGLAAEIRDTDISDWEWILGINLWGTIHMLHYFLPHMVEQESGHIINISSAVGIVNFVPIQAAYTTSKFALVGLTEVLRTEVERFGIGVTCVCPGSVKTNFFSDPNVKGFKQEAMDIVPDFFYASPENVAKKIIKAVKKNQAVVVITALAKTACLMKRISPESARLLARANMKLFLKYKE